MKKGFNYWQFYLGWGVKRENTYPYLLNELAKNNKN